MFNRENCLTKISYCLNPVFAEFAHKNAADFRSAKCCLVTKELLKKSCSWTLADKGNEK